ncbi:hypothetical protein C6N75_29840, partial [Streptomyces solincola]
MSLRERHHDVAAYALGVLEPGDAVECEAHVRRCPPCAQGLAGFAVVVSALAQLAGRAPAEPVTAGAGRSAGVGRRRRARAPRWPGARRWGWLLYTSPSPRDAE